MSWKKTKKTTGKKISTFINQHMTAIVATIIYGGVGLVLLWIFCGKHIIAFFLPTPQHKCEASISASANNIYCKEDGTKGDKREDECLAKGSKYEYDSEKLVCRDKRATKKQTTNNATEGGYTCVDVTSYDYNYDNDMLCTSPSGTQFYTDYDHAQLLMNGDPSEQYEGLENYDRYDYGAGQE